jgi:hypothetical protein
MSILRQLNLILSFVFISSKLLAFQHDSLKVVKPAKHYFKTTIYTDYYSTGKRNLEDITFQSKKLKSYQVNQFVFGVNAPVFTKDFYEKDSTQISNFHLLVTGSYSSVTPLFDGISKQHHLSKTSLGVRAIYNTGKKSIFFVEFSPYMTQDNGYNYTQTYRLASSIIYNCTVNKYFSFRLGYTRSYTLGNRYHLPYIGFRVGKLDGVNFSLQFPRSISLNVPIGKYVKTSLYTKPQGGVYSFANSDTIYYLHPDKNLNFGRNEFISGLRIDILPSNYFNFYLSAGFTAQNNISLYSETFNKDNKGVYKNFYTEKIGKSLFINAGLVFKFGKTKSIYNNYNLYDAQDLNTIIDGGENNVNTGNSQIPTKQSKIKNLKPSEVQDLIDVQDVY